ncbi:cob(I)yrinic acid a,c-diamide adenosyltransferase [Immundisolibacter sp.]|uniref:cob(I)yrinic acid a,c-diamide adenosyltransferase n=1 Tax=Immundisolibacter sp. TaxID=1934948 RepID=UPI00260F830C|nr:cob(I)yrinic acid a,c-diamide adenosyltransferase [Immundisolibacter sp.]MDD3651990.1 cob(I)yrinic acid a,c-diamide adenosyltransferase [Immundisolibacter sp.]
MGKRLTRIYTRTGDKGTTGLGDGSRVAKDAVRVEAYGTVDELNSVIGMLRAHALPGPLDGWLGEIQHRLFDLGGELCIPGHSILTDAHVAVLESWLDQLNEDLEPLADFILPGGSPAAAVCHLARTVCRRAERRVVTLLAQEAGGEMGLKYLNRLSDLLFVMARSLNRAAGVPDVLWQRPAS